MNDQVFQHLNPPQREAVMHLNGPLLILAGAGSGKTRVIVHRIANLVAHGIPPWNILAVTFTNKAAGEMRKRVDFLCPGKGSAVWVSTFHSFCAKLLRVEAKKIGLDPNFVIYDDGDQLSLIKEILKEMLVSEKQFPPGQILSAISRAKDEMLDSGSYAIHATTHGDPFRERVAHVYSAYQRKLKNSNALDFGDLIMKVVEAFRDIPELREKYQKRFRYLLVDEYQDTNHAQYLLTKYLAGTEKNICVVGDDDQSIYSWRGATIRNILEFERDYAGTKVIKLEQNYRSSSNILEAAGKLISHNEKRKAKSLWTSNDRGEAVRFVEMMNEQEEARFVTEEIVGLKKDANFTYSEFAVFYRTNAQSRVFEDALRRLTIPYTIVGALRFYERAEIKDAVAYLRVVVNRKDSLSIKRIVNNPARGLGKNSLGLLEQYAAAQGVSLWDAFKNVHAVSGISPAARGGVRNFIELIEVFQTYASKYGAATVVRRVLEESGYWDKWAKDADNDPEAAERLDNLQELINAAMDFENKARGETVEPGLETATNHSLARFLQEVSLLSDLDYWKDQGGTVTLMTVHLAKGLEFPVVFVTGLEEGLFPIGDSAFDPEELEEERRLAYVGMTRAKKKLYLTASASRRIFGSPHLNIPSRFVEEAGIQTGATPVSIFEMDEPRKRVEWDSDFEFNQDAEGGRGKTHPHPSHLPNWKVGQRVVHPDFGEGEIISKEGSGQNMKVQVLFRNGAKKKLLVKYAPLSPVE